MATSVSSRVNIISQKRKLLSDVDSGIKGERGKLERRPVAPHPSHLQDTYLPVDACHGFIVVFGILNEWELITSFISKHDLYGEWAIIAKPEACGSLLQVYHHCKKPHNYSQCIVLFPELIHQAVGPRLEVKRWFFGSIRCTWAWRGSERGNESSTSDELIFDDDICNQAANVKWQMRFSRSIS